MLNSTEHHSQALVSLRCFKQLAEWLSSRSFLFDQAKKQTNPSMNAGWGQDLVQQVALFERELFVVPHFPPTEIILLSKSVLTTVFYHKSQQLKHTSHLESVNAQISVIRPQNALSSVYAFIYQKTIILTKKHFQLIDRKISENVINHH